MLRSRYIIETVRVENRITTQARKRTRFPVECALTAIWAQCILTAVVLCTRIAAASQSRVSRENAISWHRYDDT